MSTKNLSNYNKNNIPSAEKYKIGIVVAEWNEEITTALLNGAVDTLKKHGVKDDNITIKYVPGSFELIFGSKLLASHKDIDGIIAIGAIIKGETPHFDFIAQGVTYGLAKLNVETNKPIIFTVLTTNNLQQAKDRAGGKLGNKGVEGAITLIKMLNLKNNYQD